VFVPNVKENVHLPVRLIHFSSESVSKFEGEEFYALVGA
jgi:hypothetical protein